MTLEIVGTYKAGESFACTKRKILGERFDPEQGWITDLSEPCSTEIAMHKYWWCGQVCPKCLATYHTGYGADERLRPSHGYYPPDTAERIRANIAANGGQYVPTF